MLLVARNSGDAGEELLFFTCRQPRELTPELFLTRVLHCCKGRNEFLAALLGIDAKEKVYEPVHLCLGGSGNDGFRKFDQRLVLLSIQEQWLPFRRVLGGIGSAEGAAIY